MDYNKESLLTQEKELALQYQQRKHSDWTTNYTLSRDKVITNRLTQRQNINIPLMKYGLSTILKDINELGTIHFTNIDNNEQKEIFMNEYWKETQKRNKAVMKDRANKKQCVTFGRSFRKLNIVDGMFRFSIVDPQDILVGQYMDTSDIDSTPLLIQKEIFTTLEDIITNNDYKKEAIRMIKEHYDSEDRTVELDENAKRMASKSARLREMGLDYADAVAGAKYIELNEIYRKETREGREQIILYVIALTGGGLHILQEKPLHEILGNRGNDYWYTHYPFTTLPAEVDNTDFWSDCPADTLRQPNLLLNKWISQMSENRMLRNLNMHYYDSTNPKFVPQTYTPKPWGWYPVAGNPNEVIKDVVVGDLSESLDEMQFVIGIAEKAVAAGSVQTGQIEKSQVTLGEVKLALGQAKARTTDMEAHIEAEQLDFGEKFLEMVLPNMDKLDTLEVQKMGRDGRTTYKASIAPAKWKGNYAVKVETVKNTQEEDINKLKKLQVVKQEMPNNMAFNEIYHRKLLEFAGLDGDEMTMVLDAEKQMLPQPAVQGGVLDGTTGQDLGQIRA